MPACTIDSRHSSFRSGAKDATKRHRSFPLELKTILESIEKDPMSCGDQIKCSDSTLHTRKVRIGCDKERVAPRNGYRLIYQVVEAAGKVYARLLDIYYKPVQADIESDAVGRLVTLAPTLPPPSPDTSDSN